MKFPEKEKIVDLLQSYRIYGVIKGGELCLPKDKALSFLSELENLGVGILGFDGWQYIDKEKKILVQDLSVDESIDKNILASEEYVNRSIVIAKEYILTKIPDEVDLISFTLNTPYLWKDLFPQPK